MVVPGERTLRTRLGRTALYRIRGPRVPMSPAYRVMLSARRFREVLERERPDVIEVGSPFIVPRLVRRGLAGRRVPLVGFYHADIVWTFAEPYVPSRSARARGGSGQHIRAPLRARCIWPHGRRRGRFTLGR